MVVNVCLSVVTLSISGGDKVAGIVVVNVNVTHAIYGVAVVEFTLRT